MVEIIVLVFQIMLGGFLGLGTLMHVCCFFIDPLNWEEALYAGIFGASGYAVFFG